jgi:hypothetical protein
MLSPLDSVDDTGLTELAPEPAPELSPEYVKVVRPKNQELLGE